MQERMHGKASRALVNLAEWAQDHQLPDTQGLPVPLGDRLRTLRKERGWNQDDLAQASGAAGAHQISRYEAGKITPNTDTMIRIAETFNVSLDYLLIDTAPASASSQTKHAYYLARRAVSQASQALIRFTLRTDASHA
jgi:transcriptional regulator with XRE-family HTH domain